jgi:hypothetical protein
MHTAARGAEGHTAAAGDIEKEFATLQKFACNPHK